MRRREDSRPLLIAPEMSLRLNEGEDDEDDEDEEDEEEEEGDSFLSPFDSLIFYHRFFCLNCFFSKFYTTKACISWRWFHNDIKT